MSRGIGRTQQRILDALAAADQSALTVVDLAERIGGSGRQVGRAVHALEDRRLVVLTKEHGGWRGQGQYGRCVRRRWMVDDPDGDHTRYEGSYLGVPQDDDQCTIRYKDGTAFILGTPVKYRYEYYDELNGMPTGVSLFVWLPEKRDKWLEREADSTRQLLAAVGQ